MTIKDDKHELSEFQKALKYKVVKIGDIVKEVHWISVDPDDLMTGIVLAVDKGIYSNIQWFTFQDDEITIKWFKTGIIEKLPSCYIKIISYIDKD